MTINELKSQREYFLNHIYEVNKKRTEEIMIMTVGIEKRDVFPFQTQRL